MHNPRWFRNMKFCWVKDPDGDYDWLAVFESAAHRKQYASRLMRKFPVTTCVRPRDSYGCDSSFVDAYPGLHPPGLRVKDSSPRVSEVVYLDREDSVNINGVIQRVDYRNQRVSVDFGDGEEIEFTMNDLHGTWTDKFGGLYWVDQGWIDDNSEALDLTHDLIVL